MLLKSRDLFFQKTKAPQGMSWQTHAFKIQGPLFPENKSPAGNELANACFKKEDIFFGGGYNTCGFSYFRRWATNLVFQNSPEWPPKMVEGARIARTDPSRQGGIDERIFRPNGPTRTPNGPKTSKKPENPPKSRGRPRSSYQLGWDYGPCQT